VGGEDGSLRTLDLRTNRAQSTVQAHGMRVRGVAALLPGETSGSEPAHLVGSAASDGFIRLWDLRNRGAAARFPLPVSSSCMAVSVS
jgi:WD40 repeat protein